MSNPNPMPARMCQASWFWTGAAWNEHGKIEVYIPQRNAHPELVIEALIEDCDGDYGTWSVKENGVLVAIGEINSSDPLWRNGDGPQLEAERVICYGASALDTMRVNAYLAAASQDA